VLLWIVCGVLTVGVVLALTAPLAGKPQSSDTPQGDGPSDIDVYRDQLREVEADVSRGLIGKSESEAARTEIARRLLASAAAARTAGDSSSAQPSNPAHAAATHRWFFAIAVVVPMIALSIYLTRGSPALPGRPAAERTSSPVDAGSQIAELVARAEAQLRANPSDGEGWDVIAPVYLRLGRFREAADAFRRAIDILGPTTNRLAGFAEATVLANDGVVTEPARKAYAQVLEQEPRRTEARFGLAMAMEQDGELAKAAEAYRGLLADAPSDAPWRRFVQERLDAVTARLSGGDAPRGPGPRPEDAAALAKLPEGERRQAVVGMVEGLAARLKSDGSDIEGWKKLIRSWTVLGERGKAEAAWREARRALAASNAGLEAIDAFAGSLGLER
jgi:cytochrome c-type biogenesis protein CcmH